MRTLRETIEFLVCRDGDHPRAEIEDLVTTVMRELVREDEAERARRSLDTPATVAEMAAWR